MTNLIHFKLENLSKSAQAHVFHVESPRGNAEFLFSYGALVGIFSGGVCNHLTGIRRTSVAHINLWIKDRASAERGIGDLQTWMNTYFGIKDESKIEAPILPEPGDDPKHE